MIWPPLAAFFGVVASLAFFMSGNTWAGFGFALAAGWAALYSLEESSR